MNERFSEGNVTHLEKYFFPPRSRGLNHVWHTVPYYQNAINEALRAYVHDEENIGEVFRKYRTIVAGKKIYFLNGSLNCFIRKMRPKSPRQHEGSPRIQENYNTDMEEYMHNINTIECSA